MFLKKSNTFVLCAGEKKSIFARLQLSGDNTPFVNVLASAEREEEKHIDAGALTAGSGRKKGDVALVLPLKDFDIVNVTVPAVPREAVARMLPYNLSKVLQTPVSDHIYDWQVAQKFKDRHELAVYLFPVAHYNSIKQSLLAREKEIMWFEPDVFSACAYLESLKHDALNETVLVMLIWETSVSIAVYENESITLVRSVDLILPEGTPKEEKERIEQENKEQAAAVVTRISEEEDAEKKGNTEDNEYELVLDVEDLVEENAFVDPFQSLESNSILAGFDLQQGGDDPVAPAEPVAMTTPEPMDAFVTQKEVWPEYLQGLTLEIARTGDYHTSVLKGKRISHVIIGGAEILFEELKREIAESQSIDVTPFPPEKVEAECDQNIAALCLGALHR